MNLVVIGASQFGLRCLKLACQTPGCDVTGVVTATQTFKISYRPEGVNNVLYADFASYATARGLPCRTLAQSMLEPGLLEEVATWKPEVFLVAGWYHMIPKSWLSLAPAYGLHASLLPDYSGGAPLVWAIINGETKTGITLFQMDDGVDSGPIAAQMEEPIYADDTIATLYARIELRGLELLADALPKLAQGSLTLRTQDHSKRRIMPQRSAHDGRIDWSQDADNIDRFIRAQTRPYPGAFSTFTDQHLTIWSAHRLTKETPPAPAGKIFIDDGRCSVACGKGALILDEISINEEVFTAEKILFKLPIGAILDTTTKENA